MPDSDVLLIDSPLEGVCRLTLNRPEKRNALNNELRGAYFTALREFDQNPEYRVAIVRGAGPSFCSGYDLGGNNAVDQPYYSAGGDGQWGRHVIEGWFSVWDLAKPVIAQVHGYCLAGGSELVTGCDLVYVAEDAQIGYPPVRSMSAPDMQYPPWMMGMRNAMEFMLTGDAMTGVEAAEWGYANRAYPAEELEAKVLEMAERVSGIPTDLQQLNKRSVHRAMETMGMRAAIRSGAEVNALGFHTKSSRDYMVQLREGVTKALDSRDSKFGDYRTSKKE